MYVYEVSALKVVFSMRAAAARWVLQSSKSAGASSSGASSFRYGCFSKCEDRVAQIVVVANNWVAKVAKEC
jgi:hypothetical protein